MTRTLTPLIERGYELYSDSHGGWCIRHHGLRLPDVFLTRQRAIAHCLTLIWPTAGFDWDPVSNRVTVGDEPVSLVVVQPLLVTPGWFTTFPLREDVGQEGFAMVDANDHGILIPLSRTLGNRNLRSTTVIWACKPIGNIS